MTLDLASPLAVFVQREKQALQLWPKQPLTTSMHRQCRGDARWSLAWMTCVMGGCFVLLHGFS
jgi:hypothetical protein